MADTTALAKRMKENYEQRTKYKLTRRLPTIIRLDGKAFHTYTKGLDKPFDEGLIEDMAETTKFLCENIMGVKCGYTQSDEISLLLWDADKFETQAWFDYNVQKMVSIASSMATAKFNQLRLIRSLQKTTSPSNFEDWKQVRVLPLAYFDARVFQLPDSEEVVNYFLWRQRDAEKNSIAMLAQSLYSHKELHKKNGSDMQEMCFQKGINWNNLDYSKKRGSFLVKNMYVNDKLMYTYRQGVQWSSDLNNQTVLGDLWYQTDVESTNYPNKKGRLLEYKMVSNIFIDEKGDSIDVKDWSEVPILKIRSKWESIETPMFGKDRKSISDLLIKKQQ